MSVLPFPGRLVASPCCLPGLPWAQLFPVYRDLGFSKYEAFTEWAQGRHDWRGEPQQDRLAAEDHGLKITSLHLPVITEDLETSLDNALAAARYAAALGAKIVLLKAAQKPLFGDVGRRFLDAIDEEKLDLTTVLQNHHGSAISTIQDYEETMALLDHDTRLKAILEVGHFQRAGISWQEGWDYLGDRVALIHVNDIRQGRSVPYGTGEVDMAVLIQEIKRRNYLGDIVVELELESNWREPRETLEGLRFALDYLKRLHAEN